MIQLRDYQQEFIDDIRKSMVRNKVLTAVSPTGTGKSVIAAGMIDAAIKKGKTSAFIVPRIDLLKQMSGTFNKFGIRHSFVARHGTFNPFSPAWVCSAGTLANRLDYIKPDVVFIDEAHISGKVAERIITHYKERGAWVVKLTATPKPERRGAPSASTDLVMGKDVAWHIENGSLADYKAFAPSTIDLTGVRKTGDDYNKKQLGQAVADQRSVIVGSSINSYRRYADGKRAVLYAVSILESEQTAAAFNKAGIPAAHMDAETPQEERARLALQFAKGQIKVLCNVDLITTGYDLASQCGMDVHIECVILARPTKSVRLYSQMVGRCLRPQDDKAVILDQAGCIAEHGLPDSEREWPLYEDQNTREQSRKEPERQCPKCFHTHRPTPACPECKHVYEVQHREVDHIEGELQELDKEALRKQARQEQGQARDADSLIKLGRARGYKNPEKWAAMIMQHRRKKGRA